ncbi:hypothetical protein KIW84_010911 [Lathyrus oleraceus]|uniref:Wall-associated receptor kinase C-terminal domain-containing protein n=1 Tax=Pisum sativum TaxID=3888 RepID=A0A9D4YLB1_PEA|nr:hypothetical protein KIW84_010911 [Pisum sativum]
MDVLEDDNESEKEHVGEDNIEEVRNTPSGYSSQNEVNIQEVAAEGRVERVRTKPVWMADYETGEGLSEEEDMHAMMMVIDNDPFSFVEAVRSEKWKEAMEAEIEAIEKNQTWELMDLPKDAKPIGVSSYPPYLDPIGCFRVSNDEKLRSYVFVDGDEGEIGYDNWKCEDHVVLLKGFVLDWRKGFEDCAKCENSGGYCGYGQESKNFTCICGNGSVVAKSCKKVLDINTKKHTIKLKRTDLSQNLCSPQFDDIVLSSSPLFHYLPHVKTINIYFNCPSNFSQFLHIESICGSQNQVFDSVAYDERLFRDCENYIQVPVGEDFSMEKNHLNRDELVSGLDKGFEVNYTVSEECLQCLGNQEGDCRLKNIDDFESSCYYCPDGSHASSTHCSYHHSSMFSIPLSHI